MFTLILLETFIESSNEAKNKTNKDQTMKDNSNNNLVNPPEKRRSSFSSPKSTPVKDKGTDRSSRTLPRHMKSLTPGRERPNHLPPRATQV